MIQLGDGLHLLCLDVQRLTTAGCGDMLAPFVKIEEFESHQHITPVKKITLLLKKIKPFLFVYLFLYIKEIQKQPHKQC